VVVETLRGADDGTLVEIGFDARGAFQRTVHLGDDGTSILRSEQRSGWTPAAPGADARTRLARAAAGRIAAEVHRLNRGITVRVVTPAGGSTFVAVPDDTTPALEHTLDGIAVTAERPTAVLGVAAAHDAGHPPGLQSSVATLVDRRVTVAVALVPGRDTSRALHLDDASSLGLSLGPQPLGWSVLPDPLGADLLAAWPSRPTHELRARWHVEDVWRDGAERRLAYDVTVGDGATDPRPTVAFDGTHERGLDFGICAVGHLHAVDVRATCGSCGRAACLACDPTGPLHPCSCGWLVCRTCRDDPPGEALTACVACGSRRCPDCGSGPELTCCRVCERALCRSCADTDPCCQACGTLHPATAAERAALPATLRTEGLSVRAGHDGATAVALIDGHGRREVAVVDSGAVTHWHTYADDPPDALRLRLGLHARLGRPVELRQVAVGTPDPPDGVMVVDSTSIERAGLRIGDGPWELHGPDLLEVGGSPVEVLVAALGLDEVAVPERAQLPQPWSDRHPSAHLGTSVALAAPAPPVTVEIARMTDRTVVAVSARGLVRWRARGPAVEEHLVSWQPIRVPEAVGGAWDPVAHVLTRAEADGIVARVVRRSSLVALGVGDGAVERWYRIHGDPDLDDAAALETALGTAVTIGAVHAVTSPIRIGTAVMRDAERVSRAIRPLVTPVPTGDPSVVEECLVLWAPGAPRSTPALHRLRAGLGRALAVRFPTPPATAVSIGAAVTEIWRLRNGDEVRVDYEVPPGEHVVPVFDSVTGAALVEFVVDREGHPTASLDHCSACGDGFCPDCADVLLTPCRACGREVCDRCVDVDGSACPACARQPGGGEASRARSLGRLRGRLR
jgi:hypothetical protein